MTVPIRVELQLEEAIKKARDIQGRFSHYKPVMEGPVRKLIREIEVKQFATRGRFGGEKWPALRRSTREFKRKHAGWRQVPMRRTDDLFRSLTDPTSDLREEIITETGYTLRTRVPYAKYHQSLEPRKSNLPRRAVIPDTIPEPYIVKLRNLVKGYLITGEVA